MLADGPGGKADPAFEAHLAPIGMWAEAVWSQWLPQAALSSIVRAARRDLAARRSPWAAVHGLGGAFVATAQRLGWKVQTATAAITDSGQLIDFVNASPAFVKDEV